MRSDLVYSALCFLSSINSSRTHVCSLSFEIVYSWAFSYTPGSSYIPFIRYIPLSGPELRGLFTPDRPVVTLSRNSYLALLHHSHYSIYALYTERYYQTPHAIPTYQNRTRTKLSTSRSALSTLYHPYGEARTPSRHSTHRPTLSIPFRHYRILLSLLRRRNLRS